jgi:hypothetical protein
VVELPNGDGDGAVELPNGDGDGAAELPNGDGDGAVELPKAGAAGDALFAFGLPKGDESVASPVVEVNVEEFCD